MQNDDIGSRSGALETMRPLYSGRVGRKSFSLWLMREDPRFIGLSKTLVLNYGLRCRLMFWCGIDDSPLSSEREKCVVKG